MATNRTDLLSVTRTLLRWGFYIGIGLALLMAAVLAGLLHSGQWAMQISGASFLPPEHRLFAARVAVGGVLIACLLTLPVLRLARAIVDSARAGDPFIPQSGARLRRIGWLMLAINVVLTTTMSIAIKHSVAFPPLSFTALLTVLMIFVIARIFDTGSHMRSELEETV